MRLIAIAKLTLSVMNCFGTFGASSRPRQQEKTLVTVQKIKKDCKYLFLLLLEEAAQR